MKLFLFDDRAADAWRPFALTRPIGEVRFGARTLRARIEDWAGQPAVGAFTRPWLAEFSERDAPPAWPRGPVPADGELLLMCSRFVPHDESPFPGRPASGAAVVLVCREEIAGCIIPAGGEIPDGAWMLDPAELAGAETVEVPGRMLDRVWSLVEFGRERLQRDVRRARAERSGETRLPTGVHQLGDGPVIFGDDVTLEPGVVLDTRQGGVVLGDRSEVRSGARIAGPCVTDADCRLLGGSYDGLSAGVHSYLRGEVENTITLGYVNKAHDGFIGHAVIGRWVNLGALTTASDLKNTYGPVSLGDPDG
ncbi:MAG: putative sugar nucleotidyl transferase, partial [Gemmatimonadota bacterium]